MPRPDVPERVAAAVASPENAPAGLDWQAFSAAYFPGSRRHNLKAIVAYGGHLNRMTCERRSPRRSPSVRPSSRTGRDPRDRAGVARRLRAMPERIDKITIATGREAQPSDTDCLGVGGNVSRFPAAGFAMRASCAPARQRSRSRGQVGRRGSEPFSSSSTSSRSSRRWESQGACKRRARWGDLSRPPGGGPSRPACQAGSARRSMRG
jgi:hypothetical protein